MADDIRKRLDEAEREAARLRAILEAYPDVVTTEGGLVSDSMPVTDCEAVSVMPDQSGDLRVRFAKFFGPTMVWTRAVHAESLLMKIAEDPEGGPALARAFAALREADG
jgi:hypothetical protein